MLKEIKRIFGLFLLILCGLWLVWASLPVKRQVEMHQLQPNSMKVRSNEENIEYAILENRQVRLEWPDSMRIGDKDAIILDFEINPDGTLPEIQAGLSDAYSRYNLTVEARYEVAGVRVNPANPTRKTMTAGQAVQFKWEINLEQEGQYNGRIWLSLRFIPLDGSEPIQVPIYIHDINLTSTSLFGLSGPLMRLLAVGGVILGAMLLINDMIDKIQR